MKSKNGFCLKKIFLRENIYLMFYWEIRKSKSGFPNQKHLKTRGFFSWVTIARSTAFLRIVFIIRYNEQCQEGRKNWKIYKITR